MSWTLLLLLFCVHLRCSATSAPDTDSASLLLLIFLFCFVATLCVNQRGGVNKDVYNIHKTVPGTRFWNRFWNFRTGSLEPVMLFNASNARNTRKVHQRNRH